MARIVKFTWDNHRGSGNNGNHLIIGEYLSTANHNTSLRVKGISIDILDESKAGLLKDMSCSIKNISSDVTDITKEDARELIIKHIDEALDILFKNK